MEETLKDSQGKMTIIFTVKEYKNVHKRTKHFISLATPLKILFFKNS